MLWMLAGGALADPVVALNPDGSATVTSSASRPVPPLLPPADHPTTSVLQWVRFFAQVRQVNIVVTDADKLAHTELLLIQAAPNPTSPDQAWETFLSGLNAVGYQLVFVGDTGRLVPNAEAATSAIPVRGP